MHAASAAPFSAQRTDFTDFLLAMQADMVAVRVLAGQSLLLGAGYGM